MNIFMQQSLVPSDLNHPKWDVAYCGHKLDERGDEASNFIKENSQNVIQLNYDPVEMKIKIDEKIIDSEDLLNHVEHCSRVVLEATTLGFAEILLLSKALKTVGIEQIDYSYVEPKHYRFSRRGILHRREFELSDPGSGYRSVPGSIINLRQNSNQCGFFFLGFEQERLDKAFEEFPIDANRAQVAIGIPAFKAGWEMDSIANNASVIRENNITGGVSFCAADNPLAAYELLLDAYNGLDTHERMFVAPIGTKPSGIGTAIFLTEKTSVGLLYDHRKGSSGRSASIAKWHLFSYMWNS